MKRASRPSSLEGLLRRSLAQQISVARIWLPLLIVGVVVLMQFVVVPLGGARWGFWVELLFYSLAGSAATALTLSWILWEVRQRESAQAEQLELYRALEHSNTFLKELQRATEQFAKASDLDTLLSVAAEGITRAASGRGTTIFLGERGTMLTRAYGMNSNLVSELHKGLREQAADESITLGRLENGWVLSAAVRWGEQVEGSVHSYFSQRPAAETRESFAILVGEFAAAAEASRSRTRDLFTLFEADRSVRAEGNLDRLLGTLLKQIMQRADAEVGGVYLVEEGSVLQLQVARGLSGPWQPSALRLREGFIGMAASDVEPHVVHFLQPQEQQAPILTGRKSAISLPLWTDEGLLGEIVLGHSKVAHFSNAHMPFLNLLAGQVSLAVRNARAYLQSEELAIAEERARIAREIHDGVAQSLAFSAIKLDLVARLLRGEPPQVAKAEAELSLTRDTIRESIREVRRSIFALRPIDLERYGFLETIRRYCSDFEQQNDILVNVTLDESVKLSPQAEAVLFRIFQESMHNAAKHAFAKQVWVTVGQQEDGFDYLEVKDNGRGFDPSEVGDRVTSAGGLGLRQMCERVEGRGGRFAVCSSPGQGATVYAALPH